MAGRRTNQPTDPTTNQPTTNRRTWGSIGNTYTKIMKLRYYDEKIGWRLIIQKLTVIKSRRPLRSDSPLSPVLRRCSARLGAFSVTSTTLRQPLSSLLPNSVNLSLFSPLSISNLPVFLFYISINDLFPHHIHLRKLLPSQL